MVSRKIGYDADKQIKGRKRFMTVGVDSADVSRRRQCTRAML
ncbi:hypothetical protein RI030_13450 [Aphanizomenon flos-aquae NRERC-008]|nr:MULTISPECIES: hypothetical protein [Aphanizomenon]MDJ0507158.1 hypothetical protein [Nostocales cyanobacterium LE14-WE12]MDS9398580.1 hypothetical protein [Aphanizomenon flos-aquae NRERC-008]